MPTYRIRNWQKFQHYNRPRPAWIKLHRTLLDDHDFHALYARSRATLVMLWLMAAESDDGTIPDVKTVAWRLRMKESEVSADIQALSNYLEPLYTDSRETLVSDRDRDRDREETETETERAGAREPHAHSKPSKPAKPEKVQYAPLVHMTREEHAALVTAHGERAVSWMIDRLDAYKGSKGKTYVDDARAIRSWVVRAWTEEQERSGGNGKGHVEPEVKQPAIPSNVTYDISGRKFVNGILATEQ